MEKWLNEFLDKAKTDLASLMSNLIVIVIIFILAKLLMNLVSSFTSKAMKKADKVSDHVRAQELRTSMTVFHSAARYVVYLIAIILCLAQVGMSDQISSAVVAAGVGGLIISFGAQSIIKDMLAGLFILFERQFYVGDYVKIGEYEGTVTSIAVRVTYLSSRGKRIIIPNGSISDVVNYSRNNIITFLSVPTPYDADTRRVMDVLQKICHEYYESNKEILVSEPQVMGIGSFGDSSVNLTIRIETLPMQHWKAEREMKLAIKEGFEKEKIEIPFAQIVVHQGAQNE